MSGPAVPAVDAPEPADDRPDRCEVQVVEPRRTDVGGFDVGRVLPRRGRRMVGAWCFADHMGPGRVDHERGLDIGPHPHIGLQTVTWLVEGAVLHRDSLGSEQLIRPGQLNLMTAGRGVSHAEETDGVYTGVVHGVQLWVAQPSSTRDGAPAFEHHDDLPRLSIGGVEATVIVGDFAGVSSPARRDTDHVGVELVLGSGRHELPLAADHEHALLALGPGLTVAGQPIESGQLGYLGVGRDELVVESDRDARALLIGGEPFDEQLLMWWNYVARRRDEIVEAHEQWSAGDARFGRVASPLARIDTTGPPW